MEKTLKVKIVRYENDDYIELWKIINPKENTPKYIGRCTSDEPYWIYVCDPLGYCENNGIIEDDVTVIVCDENCNELFITSNKDDSVQFPKFDEAISNEWTNHTELHSYSYIEWKNWILSYQDIDKYKEANTYEENWLYSPYLVKRISYQVLEDTAFKYLNIEYVFVKVQYLHTVCNKEWFEYTICRKDKVYQDYSKSLCYCSLNNSYVFDNVFGDIMKKQECVKLLGEEIVQRGKFRKLSKDCLNYSTGLKVIYINENVLVGKFHLDDLVIKIARNETHNLNKEGIYKLAKDIKEGKYDNKIFGNKDYENIKNLYPQLWSMCAYQL